MNARFWIQYPIAGECRRQVLELRREIKELRKVAVEIKKRKVVNDSADKQKTM